MIRSSVGDPQRVVFDITQSYRYPVFRSSQIKNLKKIEKISCSMRWRKAIRETNPKEGSISKGSRLEEMGWLLIWVLEQIKYKCQYKVLRGSDEWLDMIQRRGVEEQEE